MKRRNFLGLAGQSLALVAAAPALAPLATAAPVADSARRIAKAQALGAGYGANPYRWVENPPLVFSNDGRRAYMYEAIRHFNAGLEEAIYRELRLSTPYDLSSATCEPDHTLSEE